MARSGNWLFPTNNGVVLPTKPILPYWLMAAAVRVFGPTETAVRLPSVCALTATLGAMAWIGWRLAKPRAALMAIPLLACTPLVAIEATAATADSLLLAFTTIALGAWIARLTAAHWQALTIFTLATACALLTKGPAGLAAPGVALIALLWSRDRDDWKRIAAELIGCSVLAVCAFAWWLARADAATGGRFAGAFRDEVAAHILRPVEGHGGTWLGAIWFFPVTFMIGFAPWSVTALSWSGRLFHNVPRDARRLIVAWAIVPFAAYCFAATRLPHYVLPAWPALAVIAALALDCRVPDGMSRAAMRVESIAGILFAVSATAAIVALPIVIGAPQLLWPSVAAAIPLLAGVVIRVASGPPAAFGVGVGAMISLYAVLAVWWLPRADRLKPVPCIVNAVQANQTHRVAAYGFDEPSLDFYLGAQPVPIETGAAAAEWLASADHALITTPDRAMQLHVRPRAVCAGFDVVHGVPLTLVLVDAAGGNAAR